MLSPQHVEEYEGGEDCKQIDNRRVPWKRLGEADEEEPVIQDADGNRYIKDVPPKPRVTEFPPSSFVGNDNAEEKCRNESAPAE